MELPKAIKNIKALEKYDLDIVEQPTPWYDMKGLATVAKAVMFQSTAYESMYTMQDVDNLIELGGTDIIGVKAYRPGGGLTGTMKVLAMAQVMNIPCMMHSVFRQVSRQQQAFTYWRVNTITLNMQVR